MHKKALVASIVLMIGVLVLLYFRFTEIESVDRDEYKTLKRGLLKETPRDSQSSQEKERVRKELFIPSRDGPLQARLESATSRLVLSRKGGKEEIAEVMNGVTLYVQEEYVQEEYVQNEIDKDFQFVRVMLAKKATYYLKEDRIEAHEAQLFRFKLPGKVLPESFPLGQPLFEGEARFAELSLNNKAIDFIASEVRFQDTQKNATVSADSLLFEGRLAFFSGKVVFKSPLGTATAESGEIVYEKGKGRSGIEEILLQGDVHFYHPGGSFLTCEKSKYVEKDQKLFCEGPASLTRIDLDKENSHTLNAPGGIEVDHLLKKCHFLRDKESQIHFIDAYGEIYADSGEVEYEGKELKGIVLEGKVFMVHALPTETDRSYGYADKVIYDPKTKEMILEGDRVLIYDRINKVEISAPRLRIKRDEVTKKEHIRGEGDVRFTLDEKEFGMLKNRFKLDESAP